MVGEPIEIEVNALAFDDWNEAHISTHGVRTSDLNAVLDNRPRFFENLEGRGADCVMLGPDESGRFFYAAIIETQEPGVWYPVTAFPMNLRRALRLYEKGE